MTIRDRHDELPGEGPLSEIYQQDKRLEPRHDIDAAILSAARRAVATNKTRRPKHGWFIPVSVAATVVLSVSVVMLMQSPPEEQPALAEREQRPRLAMAPPPTATNAEQQPELKAETDAPQRARSAPVFKKDLAEKTVTSPTLESTTVPAQSAPAEAADFKRRETDTLQDSGEAGMLALRKADTTPKPDDWLKTVRSLVEQKQHEAARKELQQFRETYPDFRNDELIKLTELLNIELPKTDPSP